MAGMAKMEKAEDRRQAEKTRWEDCADAWDQWSDQLAPMADRLNQPFVRFLGVGEGDKVLDLASGPGEPALTLQRVSGPAGLVIATDLVPAMLQACRRRADADGQGGLFTIAADMEHLPVKAGCLDYVTCRFGIMFLPDPVQALGEILAVLKPEGQAGFVVFGPLENNDLHRILMEEAEKILPSDAAAGCFTPFRYARAEQDEKGAPGLELLMDAAGFVNMRTEDFTPVRSMQPKDRFWQQQLEMTYGARLDRAGEQSREALDNAIQNRFAAMTDDQGRLSLKMHVRFVSGTRP